MNCQISKDFALEVFLRTHGSELDENQKRFLRSIRGNNVIVRIKKAKKKDPRFEKLISLLREMNESGFIAALGIVER